MAYTPTVWNTGDVITAEKLNNIENGIENALTNDDKEEIVQEVIAALPNGDEVAY